MAKAKTSSSGRTKTSPATSPDWLADLEDKVHAAARTIRQLRESQRELKAEKKELSKRLEAAADEIRELSAGKDDDGAQAWKEERREIRDRVERITGRLEELLEDG